MYGLFTPASLVPVAGVTPVTFAQYRLYDEAPEAAGQVRVFWLLPVTAVRLAGAAGGVVGALEPPPPPQAVRSKPIAAAPQQRVPSRRCFCGRLVIIPPD